MKPTKLWITKYALTSGVEEAEGRWVEDYKAYVVDRKNSVWKGDLLHTKDCHTTRPAAIARANRMRLQKIASLEKQIEKLRKLKFE